MRELNIMEATVYSSPNPLTLICSLNEDGTTNLAPICFVSYLSFNPPMVGFAAGKQSHTGKRVRETGKVIVTVPSESLAGAVMACGTSHRRQVKQGGRKSHRNEVSRALRRHSDSSGHPGWLWRRPCSSPWRWATTSCTSARWTSSWAMRTRKVCMLGTALERSHLRQKVES